MTKDFKNSDWAVLLLIALFLFGGVLHIAFGIGNVVAAMSSDKASGWVQAIGAIAAIGIAIWVANRSEHVAERNAHVAAKYFIEMAEAAIGGLYVVTGVTSEEGAVQKIRFLGELREVQLIGHGIQLGQLDPGVCENVLETRRMVGRCVDLGAAIGAYPKIFQKVEDGLQSHHARDGYTIAFALIKSSWETMKEIKAKSSNVDSRA